jgi:hypothetical protein
MFTKMSKWYCIFLSVQLELIYSPRMFTQPTPEQLAGFISGNREAIEEVARLLLPQLHIWALWKYHMLPSDEVMSTVNRVLAEICKNHARFNPQKATLTTYVIRLIRLRMVDSYRSFKRRIEYESQLTS